jgi:hypothetical protein
MALFSLVMYGVGMDLCCDLAWIYFSRFAIEFRRTGSFLSPSWEWILRLLFMVHSAAVRIARYS